MLPVPTGRSARRLPTRGEGLWVHRVKLLTPQGDVLELAYDAATLELLGLEGRYREDEDD